MKRSPAWMSALVVVAAFACSATSQRTARGDAPPPRLSPAPVLADFSPRLSPLLSRDETPRELAAQSTTPSATDSTTQSRKAAAKEPPCSTPEYRQFDFWLGDWDAFDVDKPDVLVARTKISSILGGCAILEEYDQADGMHGRSFSIYDSTRKVWHQTWVTNGGRLLVIEGQFESGAVTLTGVDHPAGSRERYVRGVWKPENGAVRETAHTSLDAGKTWQPWFDITFRKHQP